jgi:hypothetical protein
VESRRRIYPYALLALQVLLLLVVILGEPGFDKPGRFGLDFGSVLFLAAVFAAAWLSGAVLSVRTRSWLAMALHLIVPIAAFPFVRNL